jgi:Nucleotidyl transferase AbiEii toxin, Type IV TA system
MSWHPEILSRNQERVLAELGPLLTRQNFYLAGGTALALDLGHRRSVDLDWFTDERLSDPLRLAQRLREATSFVSAEVAAGTLYGSVRSVRVSFFEYRYPMLGRTRAWQKCARVASRKDLAAMKLAAAAQRGSKKDFVDIYALGSRTFSLRQMLRFYEMKYGIKDVAHVLYALTYFDDADRERMPPVLGNVRWRVVKDTIRKWAREVTE